MNFTGQMLWFIWNWGD